MRKEDKTKKEEFKQVWLLPSRVSCVLMCPSLPLLLLLYCILLLLVDVSQVMWGPYRRLGSLTAANWLSLILMFLTPLAEGTP